MDYQDGGILQFYRSVWQCYTAYVLWTTLTYPIQAVAWFLGIFHRYGYCVLRREAACVPRRDACYYCGIDVVAGVMGTVAVLWHHPDLPEVPGHLMISLFH